VRVNQWWMKEFAGIVMHGKTPCVPRAVLYALTFGRSSTNRCRRIGVNKPPAMDDPEDGIDGPDRTQGEFSVLRW